MDEACNLDANDLLIAWSSYNWGEDKSATPWHGAVCPDCLETVLVVVNSLADHLNSSSNCAPCGDAVSLCAGSGKKSGKETMERRSGGWTVFVRSTGKQLGYYQTRKEALSRARQVEPGYVSDSVARTFVIDFAEPLAKPKRTADGFLLVDAVVRSVGTFPYADGPEIATKEENEKAVTTFDRIPLYLGHPVGMVKPDNALSANPIGAVTSPRVMDDGRIAASLCVWDADAISSVESKRTTQLSSGYTCRVTDENGLKFQRGVVANHVALLSMGRHGKAASLKLDNADSAFSGVCKTDSFMAPLISSKGDIQMAHSLKFDGLSFEMNDANAQAQLEKFLAGMKKDADEKLAKERARADEAEKLKKEADAKLTEKQKALDTVEAQRDGLKSQATADAALEVEYAGSKITMADFGNAEKRAKFMDGAVLKSAATRTALVVEAMRHVSKNTKLDEMSDLEIKKAVVLSLDKTAKLDGRSADYVQALYDDKVEKAGKNTVSQIDQARTVSQAVVIVDAQAPANPIMARASSDERYLKANVKNAR